MARYPFDDQIRKAFARAVEEAHHRNQAYIEPAHIALGLLEIHDIEVDAFLELLGASRPRARKVLAGSLPPASRKVERSRGLPWTALAKRALGEAMDVARSSGCRVVTPVHLLVGLVSVIPHPTATLLAELGITPERAREAYRRLRTGTPDPSPLSAPAPGTHAPSAGVAPSGSEPEAVWLLEVDPGSDEPLYEQIVAAVEEAVATGRLVEGERLPSVRDLAAELGIAPGTVARAYRSLEEGGVLVTEGARGTRVAPRQEDPRPEDLLEILEGLLRPVAVAAYHMGARAEELQQALDAATRGIYGELREPPAA